MGQTSKIEWCDSTANPVMGCDGCELPECYARLLVGRYAGRLGWPASFDKPQLFPDRIKRALAWPDLTGKDRPDKPWLSGRPRHIFWCDLSDAFSESLPEHWLAPYLREMDDSPHTHIFSTKRPARAGVFFERFKAPRKTILLTSVTSEANIGRIADLLLVPGISVRGVSLEPMLGPVDVKPYLIECDACDREGASGGGYIADAEYHTHGRAKLGWVITGGESGPGARPAHPGWFRHVRDQCVAANTPYFHKHNGAWRFSAAKLGQMVWSGGYGINMIHVGKRAAGRLLDEKTQDQMPEAPR